MHQPTAVVAPASTIYSTISQAECRQRWSRLTLCEETNQVKELHTIIRDRRTAGNDFIFYADRLIRLVVEESLNQLECSETNITTPTGSVYAGVSFTKKLCGVSVMRGGEAMEKGLRDCCRSVRIGKILIQRTESSSEPVLSYAKFPPDIAERQVMVFDPQLGTGKTACKVIEVLLEHGVPQPRILLVTLIASQQSLDLVFKQFPELRIVASQIDSDLDDNHGIVPGCGDFGDRYFRTDDDQ
ncbi:uridine kinase [Capsaspora owczarzaki ATCC 30864]|uniref:uracil phosphoribosyltransferase n=1 Tax=Capsaspora owczarzaki (strain ATCC 30864) TaxID=595528 RepID=A0A0D2VLM9_CAPO3|nr:uridine kinase [Capsaspora owczarzaki ATCC 30864]KJE91032.1 uridine kinase [Capsaspora owczarzaki ATCC 30864]|eukprot:XP_004348984.1 uridine kinase [Capsaspora owczarzaki ATCC 30864]